MRRRWPMGFAIAMIACSSSESEPTAEDATTADVGATDSAEEDVTRVDSARETGGDTAAGGDTSADTTGDTSADTTGDTSADVTASDAGDATTADALADVAADASVDSTDTATTAETASDTLALETATADTATSDDADAGTATDAGFCMATGDLCFRSHECCPGLGCRKETIASACSASCSNSGGTCSATGPCCSGGICDGGVCDFGPFPPTTAHRSSTPPTATGGGGLGAGTGGRPFGAPADYDACGKADDCADALVMRDCLTVSGFVKGLCSLPCTADFGCPKGACIAFGSSGFCLEKCSGPSTCQVGTICKNLATKSGGSASVCSVW